MVYKKQCDMTYETVVDYEYEQKCTHSYEEECHGYGYHQECEKVTTHVSNFDSVCSLRTLSHVHVQCACDQMTVLMGGGIQEVSVHLCYHSTLFSEAVSCCELLTV